METTRLGKTGLQVSRLCLGCMSYGVSDQGAHAWTLNEEVSRPFIKKALELGITFFDTANTYSAGTSEEIVGRALKDYARRDDIVLATKVYNRMRPGPNGAGLSRKAIMTEIDHSLRRLGTDYVDLYQIHRWDYETPIEETMEALHDVVKAGKARYIGASSMYAWQFAKALYTADLHGWTRFVDHAELRQPSVPRGGARDAAALPRGGHRRHTLEPAGARAPHPRLGRGQRPPGERTSFGKTLYAKTEEADRKIVEGRRDRQGPRRAARAGGARLGAGQAGDHRADRRRDQAAPPRRRSRRAVAEAHR